ncbi:hypothetical protein HK096_002895, partial [Nowakowskiella sp. JEL0078]
PSILIIAPPNSGHTSLCEAISRHYDAIYISTGQLLRTAVERQTSVGLQARSYMEKGQYVPDVLITGMIANRFQQDPEIAERGFVMDGYPRTKEQAFAFQKKGILPTHIIVLDIPDETIVSHSIATRIDPVTGHLYHPVFNPAPKSAIVEARLIQRTIDTESVVRQRLALYRKNIPGVMASFKHVLRRFRYPRGIHGHQEDVLKEIFGFLELKVMSRAPRSFRIVVAGLPGSGKTSVARMLQIKHGFVHVSPNNIIKEEISSNSDNASILLPFLDYPENVPETTMLNLIVKRLNREDCRDRGWVLENFPLSKLQAEAMKAKGIIPNRLIWLNCSTETCIERIKDRRIDIDSGIEYNLAHMPEDISQKVLKNLVLRPSDTETQIKERLHRAVNAKSELESFYCLRAPGFTGQSEFGIMQCVDGEGIGENGKRTVFESHFPKDRGNVTQLEDMDDFFDFVHNKLQVPIDTIRGAFLLIAAYPLALIFNLIPRAQITIRHVFSIVCSALLFCSMFPVAGFLQLLGQAMAIFSSDIVRFDHTAPMYFGFVFFFAGFLVGPAIEFRHYLMYINSEGVLAKIPNVTIPTLKNVGIGFFFMAFFSLLLPYYNYQFCYSDKFLTFTYFRRFSYLQIAALVSKSQYYSAWKLSEGTCTLIGFSYSGKQNGQETWDRGSNVDITRVELAENAREATSNWNKNTQSWLRRCVYERLYLSHGSGVATIVTYTTSAFWHGFYPGYYICFILGALGNMAARDIRRNVRPLFASPTSKLHQYKFVYDFLGWFTTLSMISMMGAAFQVLTLENSIKLYNAVLWYSPVTTMGALVAFRVLSFGRVLKLSHKFLGIPIESLKKNEEDVKSGSKKES